MVLYNVTIGIDLAAEKEWLEWMMATHIPRVMATEMFVDFKVFKVLSHEEEESVSYSFQYFAENVDKVVNYLDNHAAPIVGEHNKRYVNRHVAFRTLLQQVIEP